MRLKSFMGALLSGLRGRIDRFLFAGVDKRHFKTFFLTEVGFIEREKYTVLRASQIYPKDIKLKGVDEIRVRAERLQEGIECQAKDELYSSMKKPLDICGGWR